MKKRSIIMVSAALAITAFVGVMALGANELGLLGSTKEQPQNSNQQLVALTANTVTNGLQATNLSVTTQPSLNSNVQEIVTQLEPSSYPALVVQKGVPVKWTIIADSKNLNSCNNEIVIPSLGISKPLNLGENVIEFTLNDTGIIPYSCWMGMIDSTIAVVDDINNYDKAEIQAQIEELPQGGGGCSMMGGLFVGSSTNAGGFGGCCGGR